MKRFAALCLLMSMLACFLPVGAASENDDISFAKTFLDTSMLVNKADKDGNTVISGWDLNTAGGTIHPRAFLQMVDSSEAFPVEAVRAIDDITSGEVTFEFCVLLDRIMPGAQIRFTKGFSAQMSFDFEEDGLYLSGTNDERIFLSEIPVSDYFGVKAVVDMEQGKVTAYVDGIRVADAASISVGDINKVIVSTGTEAVGTFILQTIRIHRGYAMNEFFTTNSGQFPQDWDIDTPTGVTAKPSLNSEQGDITLSKSFEPQSGNLVFEFQTRLPEARDDVSFTLKNGSDAVFSVQVQSDGFYCNSDTFLCAYKEDMWQHFRVKFDTAEGKADIQINGKSVKENVSITPGSTVDSFEIFAAEAEKGQVFAEDFLLYREEIPSDYPTAPVKANSDGVAIGVQCCPLWTEGRHIGWDWINSAEPRVPILGFYDESSPEAVDWEMKYMAEHGIDFQWCCWFMPGVPGNPIKDISASRYIHNGYFNAKYSDEVKFAIMWENAGTYTWTDDPAYNREMFLKYVAPFWIEYYFKDSRYFKSDGHPVVGIYSYDKFMTAFKDSASGYSEILSMMNEFKQMCADAGVGVPFVVLQEYPNASDFGNEGAHYVKQTQMGFDGFYTYGYNTSCWPERQEEARVLGRSKASYLRFIPTYQAGFNSKAWDGASGISLSPGQFEDMLRDAKENFLPGLSYTGATAFMNLDEPIIMLASWNEYGEGHAIMPSAEYGFEYLDAVKKVFADGDHTDTAPTAEQKERIGTAYPKQRKVALRERLTDSEVQQGSQVIKGWYFDEDSEGWTDGIWENGCLSVSSAIGFEDSGMSAIDADYLRLRLKNQSDSYAATFSYTTNFYPEFSANSCSMMTYIGGESSEFTDIILPVSKYPKEWRGGIKSLNIEFNNISEGQSVLIDSVEFLGTPHTGAAVCLNDVLLESGMLVRDGKKYLPFYEAKTLLGFDYYIKEDGNFCFEGTNGAAAEVTAKNDLAYEYSTPLFELNGSLYISEDVFLPLTDDTLLMYPAASGTGGGITASLPDGVAVDNFAKNYSRHNNVLYFTFDENLDSEELSADDVTVNGSPAVSVSAVGSNTVRVDMGALSNITRYRVEFPGIVNIDYEPVDGQFVFTTGTGIVAGMEFTDGSEPINPGYLTGDYGIEGCTHDSDNGTVTFDTAETKGTYGTLFQTYTNAFGENISANDVKQIVMRMKTNVTGNFYTYLLLDGKGTPTGDNDREVRAGWTIQASDEFREYVIDTSALNQSVWADSTVSGLRMLLPYNAEVDIDYIRLVNYDYETNGLLADWDFTNKQNPIGLGTIRNVNVPEPQLRDNGLYFGGATYGGPMGNANANQLLINPSSIGRFEYTAYNSYGIENFGIYLIKRGDITAAPGVDASERFQLQQLSGGSDFKTYSLTPEYEAYANNDCNWLFFFTNRKSGQTYWDFLLQDIKIYPVNYVENSADVPVRTFEIVSGFETEGEALISGSVPSGDVTAVVGGLRMNKNAMLVIALYKDGGLVNVKTESADGAYVPQLSCSVAVPGEGYEVKAFLWDGSALKPITETLTKDKSRL